MKIYIGNIKTYLINEQEGNKYSHFNLYHGTNADFNIFDIGKSGLIKNSDWGEGIYFTRSKSQAHSYRVDAVKYFNKAYNDAYEEYVKNEKEFKETKYDTPEYYEKSKQRGILLKKFQNIGRELNLTKEGKLIVANIKPTAKIYKHDSVDGMTDPYLSQEARAKGFDVLLIDEGRYTEEFVIINPDSINIVGEIKDM